MLGERIREIRISKGLSQAALARRASISNDYMFRIEAGKVTNIGTEVIDSIAQVLEVHPSLLLYGELMTPKLILQPENDIGPLADDEKSLIVNYRKIRGSVERKIVKDIVKKFAD